MKVTTLRIVGAVLLLAGLGTVGYLTVSTLMSRHSAAQAQERLGAEFQQSLADATGTTGSWEDPTIGSTATTRGITVTTTPGEDIAGPDIEPAVIPIITEAPPEPGQALGRIVIPAAGVDWLVVEGVSQAELAQGPGHMPGTALPGQPGNSVISGHRTTYGAPFRELDVLQPGDIITVETLIGSHTYEVTEVLAVAPTDVWVTNQVEGAWLTLTTCHPEGSAQQRLIVFARLTAGPNADAVAAGSGPPQPPVG